MQLTNYDLKAVLNLATQLMQEVIELNQQVKTLTETNQALGHELESVKAQVPAAANGHQSKSAVVQE